MTDHPLSPLVRSCGEMVELAQHITALAGEQPDLPTADDFVLTITPGILGGQPCIPGHRLPADMIAGMVYAEGAVDTIAVEYEIPRGSVLVCCWYEISLRELDLRKPYHRELRDWAKAAYQAFAHDDIHGLPDPPMPK